MSGIVGSLNTRGSGLINLGSASDGNVFTGTGAGLPVGFEAAAAGGKLLQVVALELSSQTSTTSSTYVAISGLTQAITPSATSSKVLVTLTGSMSTTASNQGHIQLFRDTTQIHMGDTAGSRDRDSYGYRDFVGSSNGTVPVAISFLDSPSSTSSVTYSVKWKTADSSTLTWNSTSNDTDSAGFPRNSSSLILQEIGA